jgi:hypothetical protein
VNAASRRRLETVLVLLVTLHTLVVGSLLLFAARWAVVFGGWGEVTPLFFPRQGGAFHFAVAFGYLHEHFRHRGIALMVATKTIAFVFLTGAVLLDHVPWAVGVSGVLDGAMAVAVLAVHRWAARAAAPAPTAR